MPYPPRRAAPDVAAAAAKLPPTSRSLLHMAQPCRIGYLDPCHSPRAFLPKLVRMEEKECGVRGACLVLGTCLQQHGARAVTIVLAVLKSLLCSCLRKKVETVVRTYHPRGDLTMFVMIFSLELTLQGRRIRVGFIKFADDSSFVIFSIIKRQPKFFCYFLKSRRKIPIGNSFTYSV